MKGKRGSLFPFSCYSFLSLIRGLGARVEMRKSFSDKLRTIHTARHSVESRKKILLYAKNDLMKLSHLSTLRFVLVLRHCSENLMKKRSESPEISTIPNEDAAMKRRRLSHFIPSQAWLQFHLLWRLPLIYPSQKSSFLHPHSSLWISV